MLRFEGIPIGENEQRQVTIVSDTAASKLTPRELELTMAYLCSGKGVPPMLHERGAVRFWECLQHYAYLNMLQAAALSTKTESEKGK